MNPGAGDAATAMLTVALAIGMFARAARASPRWQQLDPGDAPHRGWPLATVKAWAHQCRANFTAARRWPAPAPPQPREEPACVSIHDPRLFFPTEEDGPAAAEAKAVCAGCPLRTRCLDYALTAGMAAGIWGGLSTRERQAARGR